MNECAPRRLRIGLTGGIGSGKSAVADLLRDLGAAVVDADVVSHQLTAPGGAAIPALRAAFGPAAIAADGSLDRAYMRERVFADPAQRARLEAILHPLIGQTLRQQAAAATGAYVVFVVPLLVENLARWRGQVDRICVVDCPEALQIERVQARSGLNAAQVRAILAAQATREQRLAAADDRIDNAGSRDALAAQVRALHDRYSRLAKN